MLDVHEIYTDMLKEKEEIKEILDALVSDIQRMEDDCFSQMAYMEEHKFAMEREAIRYAQGAYNRSWRKVSSARHKIVELMDEQETNK